MAAVSDDISDRDLRTKLKENGISCGPITPTTKNLYIRKLRKKLSEGESTLSRGKVPSRKSSSPKPSPRRALPSRRSVDPTPPPQRKLIGFSSDEDEPVKEPVITRERRASNKPKESPRKSSAFSPTPVQNEERPVFRRRPYNTSSPKSKFRQDEQRTDNDGRVNMDSYSPETKRGNLPSYAGLRNLFLRKSMEDSKKYANESPSPSITYSVEVEDEKDENIYQYTWLIWFFIGLLVVVFLLVYNWQFLSSMLWNQMNGDQLKICGPTSLGSENEACLTPEKLTEKLVEKLTYELGTALGLAKCGYSRKGGEITKDELIEWVKNVGWKNKASNSLTADAIVSKIKDYIIQNSYSWLRCVDKNGTDVRNTNETFENIITSVALKPLSCRIREAFSRVFTQLLLLCGAIIFCLCAYFLVKYRWMLRERRTRQVFELVDKILDVLKNHHNDCQRNKDLSPYLAIPHVRDMLIKPSERESMKSAWDDAVKFLSAQESRVRVESQRIAGEDFEVWRLLHHTSPSSPSSSSGSNIKQGKVWQGTAFENFTTAVNPPLISPTPCLKIRNMFEPVMETQSQWHVFIQDAILEKCNEKEAAIVHISVDKTSNEGCVYVKCANHRSSGAAFRAIHGCWFDGRLVTVKFLTLKRYHQRFPESIDAKEHLKPSGMSNSTIPKLESAPVNESDSDSDS